MILPNHPLNLVLIGPPGAGKSTIAEALAHGRQLVVVATGQRLRAEVEAQTDLGRAVEPFLEHGDLAPDDLIERVLRANLAALAPGEGVLLDGYPRTLGQARGLAALLAEHGRELDAVLALDVADDEVIRRLGGRRICEGAGESFPLQIDDQEAVRRCQEAGGRLVQRDDDQPEIIRQRLDVYHGETQPLLDFYQAAGLLRRVEASGTSEEVVQRTLDAFLTIHGREPQTAGS